MSFNSSTTGTIFFPAPAPSPLLRNPPGLLLLELFEPAELFLLSAEPAAFSKAALTLFV